MLSKSFRFSDKLNFFKKTLDFPYEHTQNLKTVNLPTPNQVRIHMNQLEEAPCIPIVKKGNEVKVGQIIAEHTNFPATFIHASVSGKITKIDDALLANGIKAKEIIIEADGLQEIDLDIKPPLINDEQDFTKALEDSGIIELNTAAFLKKCENVIDSLLINATTWEPLVATSIREILEHPDDVLNGMAILMKQLKIKKGIIVIEENQSESIACLQGILINESQKYENISLKKSASSYPDKSDHLLVTACEEELSENNALVLSVTTVSALSKYLKTGIPVITKSITVNGSAITEPKNVLVPIGTRVKDVIAICSGYKETPKKILLGGPLMGTSVLSDDATISKDTTAIFAFGENETESEEESECIRCARCIHVCPVNLMPIAIDQSVRFNQMDILKTLNVATCVECGACSFICPANRHLSQTIKLGKSLLENYLNQQIEKGVSEDE